MKTIIKEGTQNTPYFRFDSNNGLIEIKGRSLSEDVNTLFQPFLEWIDDYTTTPKDKTLVNFQLEYFNTRTSKYLLDILKKMEPIYHSGKMVEINWICEKSDFDMIEAGEDYQCIVDLPFHIIEVTKDEYIN